VYPFGYGRVNAGLLAFKYRPLLRNDALAVGVFHGRPNRRPDGSAGRLIPLFNCLEVCND
jgi:hypothetical protein